MSIEYLVFVSLSKMVSSMASDSDNAPLLLRFSFYFCVCWLDLPRCNGKYPHVTTTRRDHHSADSSRCQTKQVVSVPAHRRLAHLGTCINYTYRMEAGQLLYVGLSVFKRCVCIYVSQSAMFMMYVYTKVSLFI